MPSPFWDHAKNYPASIVVASRLLNTLREHEADLSQLDQYAKKATQRQADGSTGSISNTFVSGRWNARVDGGHPFTDTLYCIYAVEQGQWHLYVAVDDEEPTQGLHEIARLLLLRLQQAIDFDIDNDVEGVFDEAGVVAAFTKEHPGLAIEIEDERIHITYSGESVWGLLNMSVADRPYYHLYLQH